MYIRTYFVMFIMIDLFECIWSVVPRACAGAAWNKTFALLGTSTKPTNKHNLTRRRNVPIHFAGMKGIALTQPRVRLALSYNI